MKLRLIISTIILFALTLSVNGQSKDLFSKISDNKDVTAVIISKSLLRMIPNIDANIGVDGVNFNNLISKLNRLEIYTTKNKEVVRFLKKETNNLLKDKSYESIMTIKDNNENIDFLVKAEGGEVINEMLMVVEGTNESTIIRVMGNFTMDDIQGVVSDKSGKAKN